MNSEKYNINFCISCNNGKYDENKLITINIFSLNVLQLINYIITYKYIYITYTLSRYISVVINI